MGTRKQYLSYLAVALLVLSPATVVGAMDATSAQAANVAVEADWWDGLELALPEGAQEAGLVLAGAEEEVEYPELELALPDDDDTTVLAAK